MGRPGCNQCCQQPVPESCTINVDIAYINTNNQELEAMSASTFKDLFVHTGDQKPDNAPDDYDDYVISEAVIDSYFTSWDVIAVPIEQSTLQRIRSTVKKDNTFSFAFNHSNPYTSLGEGFDTFSVVLRTEAYTTNRELFIRNRRLQFETDIDYIDVKILDKEFELPTWGIGESPASNTFDLTLIMSPDIVDIAYGNSFTSESTSDADYGFCFNMKEEVGDYLTETELDNVVIESILDQDSLASYLENMQATKGGEFTGQFERFKKIEVYDKNFNKGVLILIPKLTHASAHYRDHRIIGGDIFFTEVQPDFIDRVNDIKKHNYCREAFYSILDSVFVQYNDWEIVDTGFSDAATKTRDINLFIEDIREASEQGFEESTIELVSYIGNFAQQRDNEGYRVRKYSFNITTEIFLEEVNKIIDSEAFQDSLIGEVSETKTDILNDILKQPTYKIVQNDSEANIALHTQLLSSTALPRPSDYTADTIAVRSLDKTGDYSSGSDSTFYTLPKMGLTKGLWRGITREQYYISLKYSSPNGEAFLNDEETKLEISSDSEYYPEGLTGEIVIGNQAFILPSCGIIKSRENVRMPQFIDYYNSDNIEYDIIFEKESAVAASLNWSNVRTSHVNQYDCGTSFRSSTTASINKEIVDEFGTIGTTRGPVTVNQSIGYFGYLIRGKRTPLRLSVANPVEWKYAVGERKHETYGDNALMEGEIIREISGYSDYLSHLRGYFNDVKSEFSSKVYWGNLNRGWFEGAEDKPSVAISSKFTFWDMAYNNFEGNELSTHEYVSQWPSKHYNTIDLAPNNGDLSLGIFVGRTEPSTFLNSGSGPFIYSNGIRSTIINEGVFNSPNPFGVLYHKGLDKAFFKDLLLDSAVYVASHHYCMDCSLDSSSSRCWNVVTQNVKDIIVYEDSFDEVQDLVIERYESCVAKIRVTNTNKRYKFGARFSTFSSYGYRSNEVLESQEYGYFDILQKTDDYTDIVWSRPDGNIPRINSLTKLSGLEQDGPGTLSTDVESVAKNFYRQRNIFFDSDGYYFQAGVYLAGAYLNFRDETMTVPSYSRVVSTEPCVGYNYCRCGNILYTCESCTLTQGAPYTLNRNNFRFISTFYYGAFQQAPYSTTVFPSCEVGFLTIDGGCNDYTVPVDRIGLPATVYRTYGRRSYTSDDWFGVNISKITQSDRGAVQNANFAGNFQETFTPNFDCLDSNIPFYFIPLLGDGGIVNITTPGFVLYADHEEGQWNGEDYYYHNFVYNLANEVAVRSYPKTSYLTYLGPTVKVISGSRGFINTSDAYVAASHTYSFYWDDIPIVQCEFCTKNRFGWDYGIDASYYNWTKYGTWNTKDCEEDYIDAFCSLPEDSYCGTPLQNTYSGCAIQLLDSVEVTSANARLNSNNYMFVEDQSTTQVDIRDFPQRFSESKPSIPVKNNEIVNGVIMDKDYVYITSRWGNN